MIDKSPGRARHAALPAPALLSHQLTQIKIVPGSVTAQPGRAAGSPVASDELCKPLLTGVWCVVCTPVLARHPRPELSTAALLGPAGGDSRQSVE